MIKRTYYLWAVISILAATISGCDPEEPIPTYISIQNINLVSNGTTTVGPLSSNIKDAWVYVDNDLLGVFELPARFPVLEEGQHTFRIGAGILENGISATHVRYPLYNYFDTVINCVPGQTIDLANVPTVKYFNLTATWLEDFEGNTYSFDSVAGSTTGFIPFNNDNPYEGNFSGKFTLTESKTFFVGACTVDDVNSDINSFGTAWIEMNYKADQPFDVGLRVKKLNDDVIDEYALTVNRSDGWNKIYIHVSTIVGSNPSAKSFKVFIKSTLEAGRTESNIYIDNLKLIHN